tara:strand:- start:247 stop:552 length:306 start_codon:yes stop_codon:yes gene_type:complete
MVDKYHAKGLEQLGYVFEVDFSVTEQPDGSVTLDWRSTDVQPTVEKCTEALNIYNANQYQRSREDEYPPIGDQLDDLFHRSLFSDEMTAKLQAVKDKHPKG